MSNKQSVQFRFVTKTGVACSGRFSVNPRDPFAVQVNQNTAFGTLAGAWVRCTAFGLVMQCRIADNDWITLSPDNARDFFTNIVDFNG